MLQSNINDWRLFQFLLLIGLSIGLFYPLFSFKGAIEMSCPFAEHASTICPSCGLSRAWYLLYHGEFSKAHEANPNAYKLLMLLLVQIVWRGVLLVKVPKSNLIIFWDIVITLGSILVFAGPYVKSLWSFINASSTL